MKVSVDSSVEGRAAVFAFEIEGSPVAASKALKSVFTAIGGVLTGLPERVALATGELDVVPPGLTHFLLDSPFPRTRFLIALVASPRIQRAVLEAWGPAAPAGALCAGTVELGAEELGLVRRAVFHEGTWAIGDSEPDEGLFKAPGRRVQKIPDFLLGPVGDGGLTVEEARAI